MTTADLEIPAEKDVKPVSPPEGLPRLNAQVDIRRAAGKGRRTQCPRSQHGEFKVGTRDPVALLEASNATRLQHLVPIRYFRMMQSPFTFLRGAAGVMAADLGGVPHSGIRTQLAGDCHLANFGGFASPERALLFGINDFDETLPGPFEWDLKRLAASFAVAARGQHISQRERAEIIGMLARTYRQRMAELSDLKALDLWTFRIEINTLVQLARTPDARKKRLALAQQARLHTSERAFPKLACLVQGKPCITDHPPLIFHPTGIDDFRADVEHFWDGYLQSLPEERRLLLDRFQLQDVAIKVVGVGSVGTRCAVALLMAGDNDPLFLQFKEARASVLEPYAGASRYPNGGERVVVGQKLMQAASDIFLGWSRSEKMGVDFYVRQLQDMKVSMDFDTMNSEDFIEYAEACAWALARSHAKAGDPAVISGYLGKSDIFDRALTSFAETYADVTEADHAALLAAIKSGRVLVQEG